MRVPPGGPSGAGTSVSLAASLSISIRRRSARLRGRREKGSLQGAPFPHSAPWARWTGGAPLCRVGSRLTRDQSSSTSRVPCSRPPRPGVTGSACARRLPLNGRPTRGPRAAENGAPPWPSVTGARCTAGSRPYGSAGHLEDKDCDGQQGNHHVEPSAYHWDCPHHDEHVSRHRGMGRLGLRCRSCAILMRVTVWCQIKAAPPPGRTRSRRSRGQEDVEQLGGRQLVSIEDV